MLKELDEVFAPGTATTLASVPDGLEGYVAAALARRLAAERDLPLLFVLREGQRLAALAREIAFFAPDVDVISLPGWDCLPFDRVSPTPAVLSRRLAALARLADGLPGKRPTIVLTSVNAALQRMPTREFVAGRTRALAAGNAVPMESLVGWLEENGFLRTPTVRDAGEYAVRGG
ncbi:MAG: transcription-repair coupling factor, partial [Hyphomicrobiales bacterium]|nr:transcription-repair coupling factor [Hyphomicrobiales bacterium]